IGEGFHDMPRRCVVRGSRLHGTREWLAEVARKARHASVRRPSLVRFLYLAAWRDIPEQPIIVSNEPLSFVVPLLGKLFVQRFQNREHRPNGRASALPPVDRRTVQPEGFSFFRKLEAKSFEKPPPPDQRQAP